MRRLALLVTVPLLSPVALAVLGGTGASAASCGSVGVGYAGERVAAVQAAVGVAQDGDFEATTLTAVQSAERARGLSVTTSVDQPRYAALGGTGDFCSMDTWSSPVVATAADSAQTRVDAMLAFAQAQVGKSYLWGGTGPGRFDCSGMTMQMMHAVGVNLGRVATQQYDAGTKVPVAQARPGDLLFYGTGGSPSSIYHVTVLLGGGQMVEAANPAAGVRVSAVRTYDLLAQAVRPVDGAIWQPSGLTAPLGTPPPAVVPEVPQVVGPTLSLTPAGPVHGHAPGSGRSVATSAGTVPVAVPVAAPAAVPPVAPQAVATAHTTSVSGAARNARPTGVAAVAVTPAAVTPTATVARYLQQGMTGADVAAVQRALGVTADGDFGPQTAAALTAFQSAHGLQADGVVGPLTAKALGLVWAG